MSSTKPNNLSAGAASTIPSAAEKNKQWQRELLMERIRARANQHKSFPELSKAMRMSMLEKRYALDAVEKSNLQKCLDSMQHCIKVTTRQGLVERLESLSRQLGLKFMEDKSGLFISTDMFFLEIILDANGSLTDVKVHHECKIEQQSCSELVNCLNRGDFADFTVQLEGLTSIYQLNAEPKVKTKAFVALQAIETDLYNLFQMQNFSKDMQQLLDESIVGIALKRRGGHPMKLTYFVPPYDLISLETKSTQPLNMESISNQQVGMSVTVNLEASSANKLQILPTVTFTKDPQNDHIEIPVYAPLTQLNSTLLPATFVLRLSKPLPVCCDTLRSLGGSGSGVDTGSVGGGSGMESQQKPVAVSNIMSLIIQTASEQQLKNSQKGLFVCLPDQTHCYFFTENKLLKASMVSAVPFTEPAQVPRILNFLKKQALFYTLLASCVRTQSKMGNDMDTTTILEVNAISFQQISVSLQHPYEECMVTVEFDLRDNAVQCVVYGLNETYGLLSMKLTAVVRKSLSIPITIRSLLKYWDQERLQMFQRSIGGNIGGGVGGIGGGSGGSNNSTLPSGGLGSFNLSMNMSGGGGGGGIGGGIIKSDPGLRQNISGVVDCGITGMGVIGSTALGGSGASGCMMGSSGSGLTVPGASSGYLKFKGDIKSEDFLDGPKSQQLQMQIGAALSVDGSSLGSSNISTTTSTTIPNTISNTSNNQMPLQTTSSMLPSTSHQQTVASAVATSVKIANIDIADKYKNIWKDKTPNLKNCVSITPITTSTTAAVETIPSLTQQQQPQQQQTQQQQPNMDVKRSSGGIEIIPLTTSQSSIGSPNMAMATTSSANITITPINASGIGGGGSSSVSKDKKSSSSSLGIGSVGGTSSLSMTGLAGSGAAGSSSSKRTLDGSDAMPKEKKRKKKRDDSPMGPPAMAGDSAVAASSVSRKFSSPSSSPKGGSGGLGVSATSSSSLSARPSPKHSPVYSSPKHNTASNSPKSPFSMHSPKHGSSGKPCMSTLKSAAATSLSPKGGGSGGSTGSGSSVVPGSGGNAEKSNLTMSGNSVVASLQSGNLAGTASVSATLSTTLARSMQSGGNSGIVGPPQSGSGNVITGASGNQSPSMTSNLPPVVKLSRDVKEKPTVGGPASSATSVGNVPITTMNIPCGATSPAMKTIGGGGGNSAGSGSGGGVGGGSGLGLAMLPQLVKTHPVSTNLNHLPSSVTTPPPPTLSPVTSVAQSVMELSGGGGGGSGVGGGVGMLPIRKTTSVTAGSAVSLMTSRAATVASPTAVVTTTSTATVTSIVSATTASIATATSTASATASAIAASTATSTATVIATEAAAMVASVAAVPAVVGAMAAPLAASVSATAASVVRDQLLPQLTPLPQQQQAGAVTAATAVTVATAALLPQLGGQQQHQSQQPHQQQLSQRPQLLGLPVSGSNSSSMVLSVCSSTAGNGSGSNIMGVAEESGVVVSASIDDALALPPPPPPATPPLPTSMASTMITTPTTTISTGTLTTSMNTSEYMVKSSQQGLKLTINKTNNASNLSPDGCGGTPPILPPLPATISEGTIATTTSGEQKSSGGVTIREKGDTVSGKAGKSRPPPVTGLKPGVSSGPASRQSPSGSSSSIKTLFQKSNSSGNLQTHSLGGGGIVDRTTLGGGTALNRSSSTNSLLSRPSGSGVGRLSASTACVDAATRLDVNLDEMLKRLHYGDGMVGADDDDDDDDDEDDDDCDDDEDMDEENYTAGQHGGLIGDVDDNEDDDVVAVVVADVDDDHDHDADGDGDGDADDDDDDDDEDGGSRSSSGSGDSSSNSSFDGRSPLNSHSQKFNLPHLVPEVSVSNFGSLPVIGCESNKPPPPPPPPPPIRAPIAIPATAATAVAATTLPATGATPTATAVATSAAATSLLSKLARSPPPPYHVAIAAPRLPLMTGGGLSIQAPPPPPPPLPPPSSSSLTLPRQQLQQSNLSRHMHLQHQTTSTLGSAVAANVVAGGGVGGSGGATNELTVTTHHSSGTVNVAGGNGGGGGSGNNKQLAHSVGGSGGGGGSLSSPFASSSATSALSALEDVFMANYSSK